MNSKVLVVTLMGAGMWLASSSSMALINDECAADTPHAEVVCPYIAIVRAQLREVSMPVTPVLDDLMGDYVLQGSSVNENATPTEQQGDEEYNPFGGL